jgi:hypothetical protein
MQDLLFLKPMLDYLWLAMAVGGGYAAAYHENYNAVLLFVVFAIVSTILLGGRVSALEKQLEEQSQGADIREVKTDRAALNSWRASKS